MYTGRQVFIIAAIATLIGSGLTWGWGNYVYTGSFFAQGSQTTGIAGQDNVRSGGTSITVPSGTNSGGSTITSGTNTGPTNVPSGTQTGPTNIPK